MLVKFYKYQGTGNDFIMIDNRQLGLKLNGEKVAQLCHRRYGIGSDGLILLQEKSGYDFEMIYYNSDGRQSSMCGNGGRCIVKFAHDLKLIAGTCNFLAVDGAHKASMLPDSVVSLKMKDVGDIQQNDNDFVLNTGSPHYVRFTTDVNKMEVVDEAHKIRYSDVYKAEGINVNFAEPISANTIRMRTYERGVEDETYSCGTGVVAASLAFATKSKHHMDSTVVETMGGWLNVSFEKVTSGFKNIYLKGTALKVFEGEVEV